MLRTVHATRYVTPLREGGSLPALVEADDYGLYVLKFRGAGQGPLALVSELLAGEIGRAVGLRVPELVLVQVDEALGRNEPDEEIRDLLQASTGLNLGLDYLPGSAMFDPAAGDCAPSDVASLAVWFDAFVTNIDRTPRNPNLLCWHDDLYFIDHGASLYFQHNWTDTAEHARSRFSPIREHVLLRWASAIRAAGESAITRLTAAKLDEIIAAVPGEWIGEHRGYADYFRLRVEAFEQYTAEAERAYAERV